MLKNGGDGYVMFKDNNLIKDCTMLDNEALIEYITKNLGGSVGKEYADPYGQGRITMYHNLQQTPHNIHFLKGAVSYRLLFCLYKNFINLAGFL